MSTEPGDEESGDETEAEPAGGAEADDEPEAGEPAGDESSGVDSPGGRPTGVDSAGGESTGVVTAGGEPTGADAAGAEPTGSGDVSSDEQTWGVLVHASAFVGLLVPFGNIVAPLVVWLIKRDESAFVDENGQQSVNFQLTWTGIFVVASLTLFLGIGLLLVPLVALVWLVLVVLGTVKASKGEVYDYPLTIDLVS